ncbi:O-antigen ligase family protein [Olleya namhaensis]|uniref:O-Antigen ligase n=1 Tax=Olleya namhaensis TaxID=1144750 RepID=A0A1I3JQA3_9FLAO|nr:O-antigen ligase family protein [Olleya namhaensis]SFI62356.1 O-Antigen ligase [Olleya namhaensis]
MNVIRSIINNDNLFVYLIAIILSTLFIGYAPSSIALGVFVVVSITYGLVNKVKIKYNTTLLLLMSLYLFLASSILWTVDVKLTLKGIGRLLALFLIPLSFLCLPEFSKKKRNLVLKYFTISNFCYGVLFILSACVNYLKTKNLDVFSYHKLVTVFDLNAIYVSVFFSVSLYYLLSKKQKNVTDKIGILFFIFLLILLSSKMILAILAISLFIYFIYFNKFTNTYKVIASGALICMVIALSSKQLVTRLQEEAKFTKFNEVLKKERFDRVYLWTGTSFRLFQLRLLSEQIQEDKIILSGYGLFASRLSLKDKHEYYNTYKGFHYYNYHNQYAQILSEGGVFALILLLLILLNSIKSALRSKDFLFITFSILLIMLFITESFLWVQRGLIFSSVLLCLFNRSCKSTDVNKLPTD